MALFCAAIRIDLVSLLRFLFLSHVRVFSCELFFFLHLFSVYRRSAGPRVVRTVSGGLISLHPRFFFI